MCGRYTVIKLDQIVEVIHNVTLKVDLGAEMARWNVAPMQDVLLLARGPVLEKARWGLVPSWAKDPSVGNRMINARAETIAEKPAYRAAFGARRCAIPADGFYEWRKNADGGKTPMYLRLKSKRMFAFAGLWETWASPTGEPLVTCTVITTSANRLVAPIHDRMPVILPLERATEWIDGTPEQAAGMLRPLDEALMETYAVGTQVNKPQHDGPQLVEPVEEMGQLF